MKQLLPLCGFQIGCAALLLLAGQAGADKIVLFAGGGASALPAPAKEAALREPFGTEFDEKGNAWIVEMASGNRLLKLSEDGVLTHVAGRPEAGLSGDGGPGLEAQFNGPHNLAALRGGRILVGDTWNGRVREVEAATGKVGSLAGFEVPVARAKGAGPYCISVDAAGAKLYIADLTQVWELEIQSGVLRRLAGNGKKGVPQDGSLAVEAPLVDPRAVAPDRVGNVYILERGGNALRVVDKEGRIRTVVNASGKVGSHGDGGPALEAGLNGPKHLCVDRDNSVVIADAENNLIRRYVPATGRLERVAGTGKKGAAGVGGSPEACELARPHGVTVHPATGELYITDSYNNRVLRIVREE
jgi:DNA-binding beta-propeller fold protein YncE